MIFFLWNLLLAIFWAAISGEFNTRNLLAGFLIGFIVLLAAGRALGIGTYFFKARRLLVLIGMIIAELIKSSLKIAFDIVTPTHHMRPGIIKVKLDARTSAEITMFSNLLSLTPGTLSLDISDDEKYLYVHVMYIPEEDLEVVKAKIKSKFEQQVLELLR